MRRYAIWGTATSPSHDEWVSSVGRAFEADEFVLVDDVVSIARIKGNGDLMRLTGGQCAGLITEVKSAGEVIEDMVSQALGVLAAKLEA